VRIDAFVFELIVDACESVFALITAAREDVAVATLAAVAKDPVSSVASESLRVAYDHTSAAVILPPEVSVRVPFAQTSAARLPNVVSDRDVADHTAVGNVLASDVDAVITSA
jgi:hypothetical protein